LRERTQAAGVGAREPLIGTGVDNVSDALDRRVELTPLSCGELPAAAEAATRRAEGGQPGAAGRRSPL
jgi:hypothetical protein